MKRLLVAPLLIAAFAVPTATDAATRTANCGTFWTKSGPGPRQTKIRLTTWQTAPDVNRNIPCKSVKLAARRIFRKGTFPDSSGEWMYERDGNSGPGTWIQYYGGHGSHLRIRSLADRGYQPGDHD